MLKAVKQYRNSLAVSVAAAVACFGGNTESSWAKKRDRVRVDAETVVSEDILQRAAELWGGEARLLAMASGIPVSRLGGITRTWQREPAREKSAVEGSDVAPEVKKEEENLSEEKVEPTAPALMNLREVEPAPARVSSCLRSVNGCDASDTIERQTQSSRKSKHHRNRRKAKRRSKKVSQHRQIEFAADDVVLSSK